jgi:hypothetical protein
MAGPEQKRIELDFRHRETEAGWQGVIDHFALEATSKWFEWLGWVLVLAAFQYVADQSGSRFARAIPALSVVLLWLYFNAFFFRLHFKGWPLVRSARVERILSVVVSGLLSSACWFAARGVAQIVAANTK